jgi:hypothetical protein
LETGQEPHRPLDPAAIGKAFRVMRLGVSAILIDRQPAIVKKAIRVLGMLKCISRR